MKSYQVTHYEGELLGPIDWAYDFAQHDWDHGGSMNPKYLQEKVAMLRQLDNGGEWEATNGTGWPKIGWGRVSSIGMYDGWPYWKPVPSIYIEGTGWASFASFSAIRPIPPTMEV